MNSESEGDGDGTSNDTKTNDDMEPARDKTLEVLENFKDVSPVCNIFTFSIFKFK